MSIRSMHTVPRAISKATFESLLTLTSEHIQHFRDDLLIHDATRIYENPGESFIHICYKNATHLYFTPVFRGNNLRIPYLFGYATPLEIAKGIHELIRDELTVERIGSPLVYHHYDGRRVVRTTHEQAVKVYLNALVTIEREVYPLLRKVV
ncbi:hypothetical protein [Maritalea sp.]|uniref:hypothetical protein n=1 Tax=Maritalea sp. TaxID=2003361 RepID=UPI003EF291B0